MLPAVGQGALGLECRADDAGRRWPCWRRWTTPPTRAAVLAERALLRGLGGGCQVPIGALRRGAATARLTLRGVVLPPDGRAPHRGEDAGPAADAEAVGRRLAERCWHGGRGNCWRRRAGFSAVLTWPHAHAELWACHPGFIGGRG